MSAQIGITNTYDITLDSEAVPQTVSRRQTVEVSAVMGVDGEYVLAKPLKTKTIEVMISGVGKGDLTGVTSAVVATPADLTKVSVEQGEANKGRASFTVTARGVSAFADPASANGSAAAAAIAKGTIEVLSVAYALTETVTVTTKVEDKVATATDGTPGHRQTHAKMSSFSLRGKGDIPAGLALGTGGAAVKGLNGGVIIVRSLDDVQNAGDLNDWSAEGDHYPAATAG